MAPHRHYHWPERESVKGASAPGYRAFWRRSSAAKGVVGWHCFLRPAGSVDESANHALRAGVNDGLEEMPAVYEFAVVHPARRGRRVKAYVGKSVNLRVRHAAYLNPRAEGERMWPFFEYALERGCEIWRRFAYLRAPPGAVKKDSEGDRAVTRMETRWLSYFDYSWNREANPPKRMICVKPNYFLWCLPAGVRVVTEPYAR
jgi:hypothetical protein